MFFVLLHLVGVAIAPIAPSMFEHYAAYLHGSDWLPAGEFALLAIALVHLALSLIRAVANIKVSGNVAMLRSRRTASLTPFASLAARTKLIGGLLLLLFLVVHLIQLRVARPPAGAELATLSSILANPFNLTLYLVACLALAFHLFHGGEAAHRSLGLLHPANARFIRIAARLLALLVGAGFMVVTLALGVPGLVQSLLSGGAT